MKKRNKWVTQLLNEKQKEKRHEICPMLLNRSENNPFLKRIITYNEKWILYECGKSNRWIGKKLSRYHTTIRRFLQKYDQMR